MDFATIRRVWLPMLAGLIAVFAIFRSRLGPHGAARWIGLGLTLVGLAGVIASRYTLGRSFSIKAKATALVTNGIYSRIRNPIYVSGVIFLCGIAIMIWKLYILAFLVIIIPMQIVRARREAAVLEARFGDDYRAYRQRTWF